MGGLVEGAGQAGRIQLLWAERGITVGNVDNKSPPLQNPFDTRWMGQGTGSSLGNSNSVTPLPGSSGVWTKTVGDCWVAGHPQGLGEQRSGQGWCWRMGEAGLRKTDQASVEGQEWNEAEMRGGHSPLCRRGLHSPSLHVGAGRV